MKDKMKKENKTGTELMGQAGAPACCPDRYELLDYALESLQATFRAVGKLEKHILNCEKCFLELSEIQRDLLVLYRADQKKKHFPGAAPFFRIKEGIIRNSAGFPFFRAAPAFRSSAGAVIHSAVIPFPEDFVILELSAADSEMRLYLEKGGKNNRAFHISLYIDEHLSDKRTLSNRISWDLKTLVPGLYRLTLEGKEVLKFNIQE